MIIWVLVVVWDSFENSKLRLELVWDRSVCACRAEQNAAQIP